MKIIYRLFLSSRTWALLAIDFLIILISVFLAFYFRTGFYPDIFSDSYLQACLCGVIFWIISSKVFKIDRQSAGSFDRYTVTKYLNFLALFGVMYSTAITLIAIEGIPRTIGIIVPGVFGPIFLFSRYRYATLRNVFPGAFSRSGRNVLIYGFTEAQRIQLINNDLLRRSHIFGFVVDSLDRGRKLGSLNLVPRRDLFRLLSQVRIDEFILIGQPDIDVSELETILSEHDIRITRVTSYASYCRGLLLGEYDENDIEFLLGRKRVPAIDELLDGVSRDKVIMVTGGAGSIGSELVKQLLLWRPKKLIAYDISEIGLYTLDLTMRPVAESLGIEFHTVIGSVCDGGRLRQIFDIHHINVIYHAAAYKHVPLQEKNPTEAVKTNVFGTLNLLSMVAVAEYVQSFVLVSTDKAVRPTSVMGVTKRLAEMCVQSAAKNSRSSTIFSMVRFGNVLNSSGSVLPRFLSQIRDGGPITVTHPEITRYFMSISEAAQLVIQSCALAKGGEVFHLDMGVPIKIVDLAEKVINYCGYRLGDNPERNEISIIYTGLRPGEKLYEELLLDGSPIRTIHPKIFRALESLGPDDALNRVLDALRVAIENNDEKSLRIVIEEQRCVSIVQPSH